MTTGRRDRPAPGMQGALLRFLRSASFRFAVLFAGRERIFGWMGWA